MSPKAKSVAIAIGFGVFSAILFGAGLIGPLTPSEGSPSTASWAIYALLPNLLTLLAALVSRDWIVRIALLVEFVVILKMTSRLLHVFHVL